MSGEGEVSEAQHTNAGRPQEANTSSKLFYEKNLLDYGEKLTDGFYDCGRSVPNLPSLSSLLKSAPHSGREVIVLDTKDDDALRRTLEKIDRSLSSLDSDQAKVEMLSYLVSNFWGGTNDSLITNTEKGILDLKQKMWTNVLPLGRLQFGVCRHRAIIFKYVCDQHKIPCRLVRGDYLSEKGTEGHAWNVVLLGGKNFLVDIMHDPGTLHEEGSTKAENYKRVRKGDQGRLVYAGGPGMASLPIPRAPSGGRQAQVASVGSHPDPNAGDVLEDDKLVVKVLKEEIVIKDTQIEKLMRKVLELDPHIKL